MKKLLLFAGAFYLLAGAAADAQIIFQPLFIQREPDYYAPSRPYPYYDRHRNYDWNYWRQDSRDHHNPHDNRPQNNRPNGRERDDHGNRGGGRDNFHR